MQRMFFLVLVFCVFVSACDEMQSMDMVEDVLTEPQLEPEPEPELPVITFDLDLPENEYPEGFEPLESDRVFFRTYLLNNTPVYEDVETAVAAETTKQFFVDAADFIEQFCQSLIRPPNQPGLNMYFTTRAERDDFVSILPENVDCLVPRRFILLMMQSIIINMFEFIYHRTCV